ncbi:MAG: DUF2796 domain-containing protein [Candidatus Electrothrix aestuarii]|jgi:hypothetical protein|uniref:DUF2796 domain-containing protein n=1 Tax=Candidatus Electrothrix aestuarii TaxID=3062594 RepID=A0AAU8M0Q3_9BACT|nr:DUF2796 domain-containing protein [Candidatus Electrothrix aestuarii]
MIDGTPCKAGVVLRASALLIAVLMMPLCLSSSPAFAETRQLGAHVHGEAALNVAFTEKEVYMELESPAANIVGFEHAPGNAEQEQAVHKAEERLKAGETLFVLTPKAGCTLAAAEVEQDMSEEEHEGEEEHDAHDDHDHEDEGHEDEHHEHGAHSEFHAQYRFECQHPDRLKGIDVQLFSAFPGFEKLDVQMLTPKGQTALELTPKKHQLDM